MTEVEIPEAIKPLCPKCDGVLRRHRLDKFDADAYVGCSECWRHYDVAVWPHLDDPNEFRLAKPGDRCRRLGVVGRAACGKPAVLLLKRSHRGAVTGFTWWPYCALHTYGRVVVGDQVWWAPLAVEESHSWIRPLETAG